MMKTTWKPMISCPACHYGIEGHSSVGGKREPDAGDVSICCGCGARLVYEVAKEAARELCAVLKPITTQLVCAGSLRRRKSEVGDVELLYVPMHGEYDDGSLFGGRGNLVDAALEELLRRGVLRKREGANGGVSWGPRNKFAVHVATGVPVDLFETTAKAWWNYLVCRTGPSESNVRIADAARQKGCKWHPYREGFTDAHGVMHPMESEEAVFRFVGLPFRLPWERE